MKIDQLDTMTVFKSGKLARYRELKEFNLISCGASRGGTSALGILMAHFGFDMGTRVHPETYEDLDFVERVIQRRTDEFPALIREKTAANPNWALKLPHALMHLETFDSHCTRPIFLIVVRNPFSIARSLIRYDKSYINSLGSYLRGVRHAAGFYGELEKLSGLSAPFIICEYEKILANPAAFIDDFAAVTGVQADASLKAEATALISGSGYRRLGKALEAGA